MIRKILLTVMLLIGLTISVSADEIVGTWIYDQKISVKNAKTEDEKWFLQDAKAKEAIFDNEGNYRKDKIGMGKWKKIGASKYELSVPTEPVMQIRREKEHLIFIMDLGSFGIIHAYYKKK